MKRHNSAIILDYLLLGRVIKINEYHFALDENYRIGWVPIEDLDKDEKRIINAFMDLQYFIKMCEALSEEEISIIIMNKTLTNYNAKY